MSERRRQRATFAEGELGSFTDRAYFEHPQHCSANCANISLNNWLSVFHKWMPQARSQEHHVGTMLLLEEDFIGPTPGRGEFALESAEQWPACFHFCDGDGA